MLFEKSEMGEDEVLVNAYLLPSVNVVGFDSKAAYICGRLRARLEQNGTPLDLADLEIAAIAIAGEFVLVTGNTRHFKRVSELPVENWLI